MGANDFQFDKLPWYRQRRLVIETVVLCRKFMEKPGAREFLDEYEAKARREGRLSPLLLAALDEPKTILDSDSVPA